MRTWLARCEMRTASHLDEALEVRAEPDWTPFAGGTDLMVLLEAGKLPARRFLNLWNVPELRGITAIDPEAGQTSTSGAVRIGALSTYTDLLQSEIIASDYPLVCEAARETGAVAIQNRGTIAGNIANASPAADLPPALLVYDAELELASVRGTRRVKYSSFHQGYKKMDLALDELIVGVILPGTARPSRQSYRKVGTRRAQAISKVCFAGVAYFETREDDGAAMIRDVRIAIGSVAPTVVRARAVEAVLRGRAPSASTFAAARAALSQDISPIDDIRSAASYRLTVAGNLLEEFLS